MKILIIGRGGREHALAWKVSKSPLVKELYCAPGNPGMAQLSTLVDINETDYQKLLDFSIDNQIDLTICGPEVPLIDGIVDLFKKHNQKIFGPRSNAAIIEGSKDFAKELMEKYNIPTAAYQTFTDYKEASSYVNEQGAPIVIKYDGLAAGKGVVVALTLEEADIALRDMLLDTKYGEGKVVIEEFLEGPEFSLMALVNGDIVIPLDIAQDHKRAYDNDLGPNTGGMGAYSSVPIISKADIDYAIQNIMIPTAKAMVKEGRSFTGLLYGGLIKTRQGPKVIEFNARFGDPETEVILPRLKTDLVEVILELLNSKIVELNWDSKQTVGVVLASKGYPSTYEKGYEISNLENVENTIFHMGTKSEDGLIKTNGGRVLFVVGSGDNLKAAQTDAYQAVRKINCDNLFYRTDIGNNSINNPCTLIKSVYNK